MIGFHKKDGRVTSNYSFEERFRTLKVNIPIEEHSLISPFPEFDAVFQVPSQSVKWYVTDYSLQSYREDWSNIEEMQSLLVSSGSLLEIELVERQKCAKLIQLIGQQLNANQLCINQAIVFMHRFYIFHPIQMFPFEVTAGAAFSLGSKSEDQAKNNTQILKALLNALERPESEDVFDKLLQEMFVTETFMAMTLGYDFLVKHPNKYIIEACNLLNITNAQHKLAAEELANNSLHLTTFCIRYPPRLIAAFSIHLISKWAHFKLDNSSENKPWYYYIHENIKLEMLEMMTEEFRSSVEKAPENFFSQLKFNHGLFSQKRRIVYDDDEASSSSKLSRADENDEDILVEPRRDRNKFESERPHQIKKSKSQLSQISSVEFKKSESFNLLTTQQHLHQPPFSKLPTSTRPLNSKNHEIKTTATAVPSESFIKKPGTSTLNARHKSYLSKPVMKQEVVRCQGGLDELLSSSKGIKSTVPLKIIPPKLVVKTEPQQQQVNFTIDVPEEYTATKCSKQRVSHFSKPVDVLPDHPLLVYDEPNINEVALEETVETSEASSESLMSEMSSSISEKSENKKPKSRRKTNSKKIKHTLKHGAMKSEQSTDSDTSLQNPPLRMIFKKLPGHGSNFEVKHSTVSKTVRDLM